MNEQQHLLFDLIGNWRRTEYNSTLTYPPTEAQISQKPDLILEGAREPICASTQLTLGLRMGWHFWAARVSGF